MARSNAWGAVATRWPRVGPPGQPAAAERAVGQHAHAVTLRGGQHMTLDDPGQDGVARLLGTEAMVTALRRGPLRLDDQLGRERRGADEAHLALADEVGERGQGLPDVRAVVGPVHLVKVDVAGPEPPQAAFHGALDPPG